VINGVDKFREYFANHTDQYVLIGGAACDLLFEQAGLPFRATKDFDVVLAVEVVGAEFATTFAEFLKSGGYQAREKSDGKKEFFRFHKPKSSDYPYMIELFSRRPKGLVLPDHITVTRISVKEDIVSLSAILLNDDYYAALQDSKTVIDGISILDEALLVPFKARAYLDLTESLADGAEVDEKQIKKHRNDVFRLLQLLPGDRRIVVPETISTDLKRFVLAIKGDEGLQPKSFGVNLTRSEGVEMLTKIYGISLG
jgi:hypothetical protein